MKNVIFCYRSARYWGIEIVGLESILGTFGLIACMILLPDLGYSDNKYPKLHLNQNFITNSELFNPTKISPSLKATDWASEVKNRIDVDTSLKRDFKSNPQLNQAIRTAKIMTYIGIFLFCTQVIAAITLHYGIHVDSHKSPSILEGWIIYRIILAIFGIGMTFVCFMNFGFQFSYLLLLQLLGSAFGLCSIAVIFKLRHEIKSEDHQNRSNSTEIV